MLSLLCLRPPWCLQDPGPDTGPTQRAAEERLPGLWEGGLEAVILLRGSGSRQRQRGRAGHITQAGEEPLTGLTVSCGETTIQQPLQAGALQQEMGPRGGWECPLGEPWWAGRQSALEC